MINQDQHDSIKEIIKTLKLIVNPLHMQILQHIKAGMNTPFVIRTVYYTVGFNGDDPIDRQLTQPEMAHRLSQLHKQGILFKNKQGKFVTYYINYDLLEQIDLSIKSIKNDSIRKN